MGQVLSQAQFFDIILNTQKSGLARHWVQREKSGISQLHSSSGLRLILEI